MSKITNPIKELLESQFIQFQELNIDETKLFFENWKAKSLMSIKKNINPSVIKKGLYWHAFSFNLIPHYKNEEAELKFQKLHVKQYYIVSSNLKITGLLCNSSKLPYLYDLKTIHKKNPFLFDLYISHYKYNWSFVITHEDDFGPYFIPK